MWRIITGMTAIRGKLLQDKLTEMKSLYIQKNMSMPEIAMLYGTSDDVISRLFHNAGVAVRPRGSRPTVTTKTHRRCSTCREWKSLTEFKKNKSRNTGRNPGRDYECKPCWTIRQRKMNWKKNYGLTPKEYFNLLQSQGGTCAICHRPASQTSTKKFLHVDHDHTTGQVRGLLCHSCNTAIGLLAEDPAILTRIAEYLKP